MAPARDFKWQEQGLNINPYGLRNGNGKAAINCREIKADFAGMRYGPVHRRNTISSAICRHIKRQPVFYWRRLRFKKKG
jgi:hypothetical protein